MNLTFVEAEIQHAETGETRIFKRATRGPYSRSFCRREY